MVAAELRYGAVAEETDTTVAAGHAAMIPDRVRGRLWAQRLKRVFKIDIETCDHCGGAVKIIACIEDPMVIETTAWMHDSMDGRGRTASGTTVEEVEQRMEQLPKILTHLNKQTAAAKPVPLHERRAPPQAVLFDAP